MSDSDKPTPPTGEEPPPGEPLRRRWTGSMAAPSDGPWAWLRRTARLWGFLAFILIIVLAFRTVIMPFALALLVAYILAPLLKRLNRVRLAQRAVPQFIWIILIYGMLLGMGALFVTSLVPRLSKDIKRVVEETPAFWKQVRKVYVPQVAAWVELNFPTETAPKPKARKRPAPPPGPKGLTVRPGKDGQLELNFSRLTLKVERKGDGKWLVQVPQAGEGAKPSGQTQLADTINQHILDLVVQSETRVNQLFRIGQTFLRGILDTITTFILVLMISAFLLGDYERILRWFRKLVPPIYFEDFDNVIGLIDKGLNGAIRGQFIICIINGLLTWVGLQLIGVKYPLLLGLLAGIMSLIPIFGSIISSIPICIVALVSGEHGVDIIKGVLILVWIIGIHLVEANLLNPKIMGTAAKIHPVLVIFAVVAGERTYGPVGALLGVPLFSAVQALFVYIRAKSSGEELEE